MVSRPAGLGQRRYMPHRVGDLRLDYAQGIRLIHPLALLARRKFSAMAESSGHVRRNKVHIIEKLHSLTTNNITVDQNIYKVIEEKLAQY